MRITADARIPFPRPLLFATYRDKLPELVPYLPNVRGITVKSRDDRGDVVDLVNVWSGGGEIPAAARAFISEAMLACDDLATWNASAFDCSWRIRAHAFADAVRCTGTNVFKVDGDGTILQIRGELSIDGSRIAGVPRLLAGTVRRTVEDLLTKQIAPNLMQVSEGLRRYLEATG